MLINRMMEDWASQQAEPVKPVKVFGGITLNKTVGGLNPAAVEKCLGFPGMKYVWLPMVDSYHHQRVVYDNWAPDAGIQLLDGKRKVKGELKEIMRICADNDLVFASGHYPYEDSIIVMEEAKKLGVKHCELIHPTHIHSKHTIKQMKEYCDMDVMIMLNALGMECFPIHETGPIYAAQMIEELGTDHLVFGTATVRSTTRVMLSACAGPSSSCWPTASARRPSARSLPSTPQSIWISSRRFLWTI